MDLKQFKSQVIPLKDKFYRYALWQSKNPVEAEDMVQEAFIRLWKSKSKLGLYNSIEALGYRIIKNIFLDAQRKSKKMYVGMDGLEFTDQEHTPEGFVQYQEANQIISRIVAGLPDLQREVLRLRNIEGYSMKKIAKITGIKHNTIEVMISRIRKKIRQEYLKEHRYENQ